MVIMAAQHKRIRVEDLIGDSEIPEEPRVVVPPLKQKKPKSGMGAPTVRTDKLGEMLTVRVLNVPVQLTVAELLRVN